MKPATPATYKTIADTQAQSAMNLRHLTLRFAMLTALLMMAVGVKAQLADGVYTVNNATGQRGTMCFGTYNSTEYFGMCDITLGGHQNKSITVADDALEKKYWYITTKNGRTYLYNIGNEVFLQKHANEAATCGPCNGGFSLEATGNYYRIVDDTHYLSFCCYQQPSAQMRWLTNNEEAATLITFNLVDNGTTTYAEQIKNANTQIDETHEQNLGYAPKMSTEEETYSYRILNTRRYVDNNESRYIYPLEENGTYGRRLKMTTESDETSTSEQYWYFLDAGNGYCYIVNRNTGCYIYHNTAAADNMEMELSATHRTEFKIQASVYTSSNGTFNTYNILPKGSEGNSLNPHGGENGYISVYGKGDGGSHWFFDNETNVTRCPNPEISLIGKNIEITAPDGYTIYYTTDGTVPTTSSTQYTAPFPHDNRAAGDVILSITTKEDRYSSTVVSQRLEASPLPTILPNTGYTKIRLTCGREDAYIYYTTNGDEPNYGSATTTEVIGSVDIPYADCIGKTIKAYSLQNGYLKSAVAELTVKELTPIGKDFDFSTLQKNGIYYLSEDITLTSHTPIEDFIGILDGNYHTISGLTKPLFASANGATIKNVVIADAEVDGSGNVGAIVGTASGNTRIYNCGVLSGSVSGGTNVGSIAGSIEGNARVINCYSFANVSRGVTAGGIVGYNSVASTANNLKTLVMNCMYYGNVTDATSCYPIYGGQKISNAGANGINNYNYYRHEEMTVADGNYNCALAAEERYLTRFEFYRHILNSHRELCAFYVAGNTSAYEEIGKWVLDESAKYPIIKPWGKYASAINKHNTKVLGTLAVSISGQNATGNSLSQNLTLNITDIDAEIHDYNYYKVQLPYYNDYFDDNYTNNKVVTGWKITSITGGNTGELTTTGNNRYNFADRNCTAKDLYSTSGRVLAQGGYFNVPEGVTAITIEPYWGKAVYLCDATYDVTYSSSYTEYPFHTAGATPNTFNGQPVYNSLNDVWGQLANSSSVYDNAIVLCGNFHSYSTTAIWSNGTKGFTLMSVDKNKDNEPDYSLYFKSGVRLNINPVRFDFINHVGIGRAAKVDGTTMMPNIGIFGPKGWFEITETALALYTEFEYQVNDKTLAPLILNGGIYEQFCSALYGGDRLDKTSYIIVGGNCYFNYYAPGCQSGATKQTAFPPVTILGGEYKEFYLSGVKPDINPIDNYNALCYGNGGRIGTFAGAYQEQIDGDVIIKLDHMNIDQFYGGGTNDKKPITGNIDITINNSKVGIYCGGPKFGNMSEGKTVTTSATNTTFDTFYGGGYGGTSLYSYKNHDAAGQATYNPIWFNDFATDRGKYKQIASTSDKGILTGYAMEHFNYSGGDNNNARFYTLFASLSVAEVRNVNTMLTDCTIRGDLYGGGCLGKATGAITTTLNNCTIGGNVFAGGYSATAPTCNVMSATPPTFSTYNGNTGTYTPAVYPAPEAYKWTHAERALEENTLAIEETNGEKRIYTHVIDLSDLGTIHGNTSLTITGNTLIDGSVYGGGNMSKVVDGQTTVVINGKGVVINENVFGGGNQAEVTGNTNIHIKDGRINGNVFGGGNQAVVTGKTAVVIGDSNNPEFNLGDEKTDIELGAPERNSNRNTATE